MCKFIIGEKNAILKDRRAKEILAVQSYKYKILMTNKYNETQKQTLFTC